MVKSRMPAMEITAVGGGFETRLGFVFGKNEWGGLGSMPTWREGSWERARARLAPAAKPARAMRVRSRGRESSFRTAW